MKITVIYQQSKRLFVSSLFVLLGGVVGALENTQQLLNVNKVVAPFGYNSATVSLDALPLLASNRMMLFAPFTG